jgi:hypothetical protein
MTTVFEVIVITFHKFIAWFRPQNGISFLSEFPARTSSRPYPKYINFTTRSVAILWYATLHFDTMTISYNKIVFYP